MSSRSIITCCLWAVAGLYAGIAAAQNRVQQKPPLTAGENGRLVYTADERGNRIPDFSYCGYMAGERPIPDVPVRLVIPVIPGDATVRIQAALDQVAALPPDRNGLRGAVLLLPGVYEVYGALYIRASGVVLRGSGMGPGGTVLLGAGEDRQTLVTIAGRNDRQLSQPVRITDAYVPVNARQIKVAAPQSFKAGDPVLVHRPSTREWINELGMDHFGGGITALAWKPGQRDIYWDRTIVAVNGDVITLDAPLTTALDTAYGGGTITAYHWPGRIAQAGVENLRCRAAADTTRPKDEDHRWTAISLAHASDAWVRQVVFEHFAGSAVAVEASARRITVEDCKSLSPVSEIGGQRRYTYLTAGQQTLFQRCYAEQGYHDFAAGFCAAGPNAFVQCASYRPYSFSGAIDSWASGLLFDIVNIDGQALSFMNRGQDAQGAGWCAANGVMWQCSAARIDNYRPPGANNWVFGAWAQFAGDGYWSESNEHIQPRSLYYAQLAERIGDTVLKRAQLLPAESEASSSPSVAQAAALTELTNAGPALTLPEWIDRAPARNPIPVGHEGVKTIHEAGYTKKTAITTPPLQLENGWLVRGHTVLTGSRHYVSWWRGDARPYGTKEAAPHITRFVPGRTGAGLTDDLNEVAAWMKAQYTIALEHNYGLWYDRRRDDHERVRRMNGEVWAPFYELPFARSGKDSAWDGLSKYDLTRYNKWYWMRLKQFATLADQQGLLLIHQQYFQHNILEAGAHWADFPWRAANNINSTGFPEPPPYAGDKRIFMDAQFYDVAHPVRRALHRAYIRQCLENFKDNSGVIQLTGAEFTGPLPFMQFWIDVVQEWEKETGRQVIIGLSATKDVQDAILNDPARAAAVDVIDIRYWHYQANGAVYAPKGGQHLAPRQHARLLKPKKSSFEQAYRAVQEYRRQYPGKAVIWSADGEKELAWAVFMAGGSLAGIPAMADGFLAAASGMQPLAPPPGVQQQWALVNDKKECIIYSNASAPVQADLVNAGGTFHVYWFEPSTGRLLGKAGSIKGGKLVALERPQQGPVVVWITRSKMAVK